MRLSIDGLRQTRLQMPAKIAKRVLAVIAVLLFSSCAPQTGETTAQTPKPAEIVELRPKATPSAAVATQAPDMLFEDDGDIYFSDAYKARFAARTYTFDHTPRVLIYHTHAREAFLEETGEKTATAPSAARAGEAAAPSPTVTPSFRSDDPRKTVVRLGDLLAQALAARGFIVFHDSADVEAPALSTAYERSLSIMQKYEGIDLYIDLHRNAASVEHARDDVVMLDGERVARMFFVVGTGMTAADQSHALENWRENYSLALSLTQKLTAVDNMLAKDIRVKQKAYNQQTGLCLLAEIGHNANLLTDAEHTIPYFADALQATLIF